MEGDPMNINNGVIEAHNQDRKVSIESNNMETSEVVLGDQSHNQEDGISNYVKITFFLNSFECTFAFECLGAFF